MNTHIFTVDGMPFVSGLFWYPLSGITQTERTREIRDLAEEQSFDLYILRSANTHHVGFTRGNADLKTGVSSAAAVVSKTLELESEAREFIFVAPLPDGHWIYVAQRDGVILPDGDKCFSSEDMAKSRLLEDVSLGNWSLIIAPDMWGVDGSTERSFEAMLPQTASGKRKGHKWWRLTHVSPYALSESQKKILAICVFAALMAAVVFIYFKYMKEDVTPAQVVTNIQQQVAPPPPPPPPPVHPWKMMPLPRDLVLACMDGVESVNLFPGNWQLMSVRCNRDGLIVSWKAGSFGWIDHIKAIIPDVVVVGDGKSASLRVPISKLTIGKDEVVMLAMQRKLDMYAASQRYGIQIALTDVASPPPTPPAPGQPVAPPQDWATVNWRAQGVSSPLMVVEVLDGPGFRLNGIDAVWMNGALVWNMEGSQYVQP